MAHGLLGTGERCFCNKCSNWKPELDFSLVGRAQHKRGDENAMCLECVDKLYRNRLGKSEVNAWIKEDRERMLARTLNPDFEEMTGEKRIGKAMHSSELITKLTRIVPNLVAAPGNVGDDISFVRIYGDQIDFICYTNQGWLPEFSQVEFNADRQPIHERRGWRTVLIRFIKFGLLTEAQAEKEFGKPSSPQQARFWERQLYWQRNNRTSAV